MAADDVDPPFLNPCLADGLVQLRGDVVEGDACRSGGEAGREGGKEGGDEKGQQGDASTE